MLEWKSEMSGSVLSGGTKTVDRDPLLTRLTLLSIDKIVLMEPVGERVTDTESGTATGRFTASLYSLSTFSALKSEQKENC